MIKQYLIWYLGMIVLDLNCLILLRRLVYSFILSKRNLKSARKIHLRHNFKERFTLSYVFDLSIYKKQCRFFTWLRMAYIYSVIPIYLILVPFLFMPFKQFFVAVAFICLLKFVIMCYVSSRFVFGHSSISIYDKRAKKRIQ